MTEERIARINELYHKSKTPEGLTEEEKQEQITLKAEYIQAFRNNLRGILNNVSIVEKDGTVTPLHKKNLQ